MKKVLSLILILSTCLSLCLALVSCGGEKNPYQTFLKSNGEKKYSINEGSQDDYPRETVLSYNRRFGEIRTGTDAKLYVDVEDTTIVPKSNDDNTTDYRLKRSIIMHYDMRDTVLKVRVFGYAYDCNSSQKSEDSYEWTDGFYLTATRSETLNFEFDINKYFENGKLTADDAIGEISIDISKVGSDKLGIDSKKYTERNPEWDEKVIDDVLELVNELLGEVDKIVEEKNA